MFPHARAAGLPMLGGVDFYVPSQGRQIRAHFWQAHCSPSDPDRTQEALAPHYDASSNSASTIVLLPGFTEFCEKYSQDILRLHNAGMNVLILDWPGQGLSGHHGRHPLAVHCDDFAEYLDALDAVIDAVGLGRSDLVLFGHSMGGHLALRYVSRRPAQILGVIVSAPMMAPPVMPVWLIRAFSALLVKLGLHRADPPFYRRLSLDWVRHFRPENPLTRYPSGYESQFIWFDDQSDLRRSGPTIGWVSAAYRSTALYTQNPEWLRSLNVPLLALVAGDERVVFAPATDYALQFIAGVERHDFADARHELLHELPDVTERVWNHVFGFIDRVKNRSI